MRVLSFGNINLNNYIENEYWTIDIVETKSDCVFNCSNMFYDVIIFDLVSNITNFVLLIEELREKHIFTPIILIYKTEQEVLKNQCLNIGADMYLINTKLKDLELLIKVVNRRNKEFQSPTIDYCGISLNKANGKICYNDTSLSVSPIEIEIFRLLTRTTKAISINKLSKKMMEPKDKVLFFGECLQKKLGLLQCPVKLEIKNNTYRFKKYVNK